MQPEGPEYLAGKKFSQENLDLFWYFVRERHLVWHRRFVLNLPQGRWTRDAILRTVRFTNIYRNLDRGTVFLFDHVLADLDSDNPRDSIEILWVVIAYRLLNNADTFASVPIPSLCQYPSSPFHKELISYQKASGNSAVTTAHITCQLGLVPGSRLENYKIILDEVCKALLKGIWGKQVLWATSPLACWKTLREEHGIGPFLAYEILTDLIELKMLPFDHDQWANIGPGALFGLRLIFPYKYKKDLLRELYTLRDMQVKSLGKDFPYWQRRKLTLRDIEHAVCEFGKYHRMKFGYGKQRQRYLQPSSMWDELKKKVVF